MAARSDKSSSRSSQGQSSEMSAAGQTAARSSGAIAGMNTGAGGSASTDTNAGAGRNAARLLGRSPGMANSPTAKEIVRSFYDLWNNGSLEGLDKLVSPDVVDHSPFPGQAAGYAGLQMTLGGLMSALSNINLSVDKIISQGDIVAAHWSATAKNTGNFLGYPASGKDVSLSGTDMFRIQNGKIVEAWHSEDFLGVLQALGVFKPQAAPASHPEAPQPGAAPEPAPIEIA